MMNWVRTHVRTVILLALLVIVAVVGVIIWGQRPSSLGDTFYSKRTTYWIIVGPDQGVTRKYHPDTLPLAVVASRQGRLKFYPLSQSSDRSEITLRTLLKLSNQQMQDKLQSGEVTSQPSDWRQAQFRIISDGHKKTVGESLAWEMESSDSSGVSQFQGHLDFAQPLNQKGRSIYVAGQRVNGFVNRDGMAMLTKTASQFRLNRYHDKRVTHGW